MKKNNWCQVKNCRKSCNALVASKKFWGCHIANVKTVRPPSSYGNLWGLRPLQTCCKLYVTMMRLRNTAVIEYCMIHVTYKMGSWLRMISYVSIYFFIEALCKLESWKSGRHINVCLNWLDHYVWVMEKQISGTFWSVYNNISPTEFIWKFHLQNVYSAKTLISK